MLGVVIFRNLKTTKSCGVQLPLIEGVATKRINIGSCHYYS